jgi:DNA repair exonuclease SbcCD ATPase subunit
MNLIDRYNEAVAQSELLDQQLTKKCDSYDAIEADIKYYEEARWVITEVTKQTQLNFKEQVESLVTIAIQSVFDRPFEFKLEFNEKPTRLEIQPVIKEGDNEYIPKHEMGGGMIDLISFAFRVVLWALSDPQPRNTIILDEPLKMVGSALIDRAGQMIKKLSDELNLQIILISHEEELIAIADKAWQIEHDGTKSKAKVVTK